MFSYKNWMKRKFKGFIILLLLLNYCWLWVDLLSGKEVPGEKEKRIKLVSISFNHDRNSTNIDAINIKTKRGKDVHAPEWKNGEEELPVAFIINRENDKDLKIKVIFSTNVIGRAKISAKSNVGDGLKLEAQDIDFNDNGPLAEREFEVNIPNRVKTFSQEWNWYYQEKDNNGLLKREKLFGKSKHKFYILVNKPKSPWELSGNNVPNAKILDYACSWAIGATAELDVAKKITTTLYEDVGAFYQKDGSWYTDTHLPNQPFNFNLFMENIESEFGVGEVNCVDMAKALIYFSNSVGCDFSYPGSRGMSKYCNCIKLVGVTKRCCESFDSHSFCLLKGRVFDAALKTYSPAGHEEWMTNKEIGVYHKKLIRDHQNVSNSRIESSDLDSFKTRNIEEEYFSFFRKEFFQGTIKFIDFIYKTEVISGIQIDCALFEEIGLDLKNYEFCQYYSLKTNPDKSHSSVIRKLWRNNNDILDVTMQVDRTNKIRLTEFTLSSLYIYLTPYFTESYSSPQEILRNKKKLKRGKIYCEHHNVKIDVKLSGACLEKKKEIEFLLNCKLKAQDVEDDYAKLKDIPVIKSFSHEEKLINNKKKITLKLDVCNQGLWQPIWRLYKGEIDKDINGNYLYYNHKPGINNIKVFVVNYIGLITESKILKINVDQ